MTRSTTRRQLIALLLTAPWLAACAQTGKPQSNRDLKGMGMVVQYELAPGASEKEGVNALSDAGNRLFGKAVLTAKNSGVSSGGGSSFPRWARVTWRKNVEFTTEWMTSGIVTGDYTVEVLSRIPAEVFTYVAARSDRVIKLIFRLKDDGVLLAWEVQEDSPNGRGWYYKMHGGDF